MNPSTPGTASPSRNERRAAQASAAASAKAAKHRGGRNLPVALGVGLALGGLVIASLAIDKRAFLVVATLAAAAGAWELMAGLAHGHIRAPRTPCVLGALIMVPAAYYGGGQALLFSGALTCVGVLLWRGADGAQGAIPDIAGGFFVTAYVPLLTAFAALMLASEHGAWRVAVFVIVTICSDVGGYAAGASVGKHPMAPSVSPKKSWEGFAGSVVACVIAGVICVTLALDGSWWVGVVLGLAVVVVATIGDLSESMVKRDLGVKDMGNVLPGHGGMMDRLDSLLLAAPVVWAVLAALLPG